ncbi:MAG: 23S rRNA (adenine(2503)-C(2))-methyltransferase RlmN [Lachnospiraceae bacterium]|nr:23S rRNA (adenine(2503)-C(2))-methyltransferase RlmN [Lachnospiraceae bacterium]
MEKTDIKSLNLEELKTYVTQLGEKPFRAKQLYEWMHVHLARDYEEMTNIPGSLKEKLKESAQLTTVIPKEVQISKEDGTRKYLFELGDENFVESVLMRYQYGLSVCISSQVGCKMGCSFCASTLDGWLRNLTPSEMLDQIYAIQKDVGERVSHVVVMGTGEPLDNYENLLKFIRLLTDENGLHISQRNVTVSTCGIVPRIRDLAKEKLQITLALSLHASSQQKREKLMPVAKTYDIREVLLACEDYYKLTGRRMSYEYSLIAGENDSGEDAKKLGELLSKKSAHVNLIPVNPIKERSYRSTAKEAVLAFKNKLEKYGITVTIRRELGRDIDGACGQLRRRIEKG